MAQCFLWFGKATHGQPPLHQVCTPEHSLWPRKKVAKHMTCFGRGVSGHRTGLVHAGLLQKGVMYKVMLTGEDGQQLERRDPYARQTDYETAWCIVDDASSMPKSDWQPLPFDEYLIYEVSFTSVWLVSHLVTPCHEMRVNCFA